MRSVEPLRLGIGGSLGCLNWMVSLFPA